MVGRPQTDCSESPRGLYVNIPSVEEIFSGSDREHPYLESEVCSPSVDHTNRIYLSVPYDIEPQPRVRAISTAMSDVSAMVPALQ